MTADERTTLAYEARSLANDAATYFSGAEMAIAHPGHQVEVARLEKNAREAAKRAAILLERIARE